MAISFNQIPTNTRVPKSYFEVDPQNPFVAGTLNRMLLVGARNNDNAIPDDAPNNRPIAVSSGAQADTAFGRGSQLAIMCRAALAVAPQINMWAMAAPLQTPTQRTVPFVLSFTGSETTVGNGEVYIDINGVRHTVSAAGAGEGGAGFDGLGSRIASQLNADTSDPYSVSYVTATDTLTFSARTFGEITNGDTIVITTRGVNVTFTAGSVTNGSGGFETDASNAGAIQSAVTSDEQFDMVVIPSALDDTSGAIDSANTTILNAFETQMERRWLATVNAYGHILTSFRGTSTQVNTLMATRNNQYETIVCYESTSPTSEAVMSATYGARVFASLVADPARPATTLSLRGVVQPSNPADVFTETDRNNILNQGGATIRYVQGEAEIERATTTRRNTGNAEELNWFDIQTPFTVVVVNRAFRNFVETNFLTQKLVDDGNIPSAGSNTVTPSIIKSQLSNVYRSLSEMGLVENPDQFDADPNFTVQRREGDPTRLDISLPVNLVNQVRVMAIKVNFRV